MLVEFDVDAVVDTARSATGENVLAVAVYDSMRYEVEYLDESVFGGYGNTDELFEVNDSLHEGLLLDYIERRLLDDVHPDFGRVQASVTYFEWIALARLLTGKTGVFVAVEPDAAVSHLVSELRAVVDETT